MEAQHDGRTVNEPLSEATARLARFLIHGRGVAIGGLAIIARVKARTTDDLDVVIAASASDIPRLLDAARDCGYRYEEKHVQDFAEMGLMRFQSPHGAQSGYGLDVILADNEYLQQVVERATPVTLAGSDLPVATLEDLVLLKLDANRPLDIDDVLSIKDAFGASLDFAYLEKWADRLRLRDRLDLYFERS